MGCSESAPKPQNVIYNNQSDFTRRDGGFRQREPAPPPRTFILPGSYPPPPPPPGPPIPRGPNPPPPPPPPQHQRQHRPQIQEQGYVLDDYGLQHAQYDFRRNPTDLDRDFGDPPTSFPFTDPDFGLSQALPGVSGIEWKRPGEFCDAPVLISGGTARYDVGQGAAGTCWFLSIVALLAERPKLFRRVVPADAWNKQGGFFHCCMWRYGEWEDVYIDDYIPVRFNNVRFVPWGARSKENPNELWPSLLEKAFARFHGDYKAVYGGQPGDAFLTLTGGSSEQIMFDKELVSDAEGSREQKIMAIHSRLKNAINSKALVATDVPSKFSGHMDLVGGHAYSLTGAVTIQDTSGNTVHLLRIRNPWGRKSGRVRGQMVLHAVSCFSSSREWQTVSPGTLKNISKDDGEFWINLTDFTTYFSCVTICAMTPDFDEDGKSDTLNRCTTLLGDWVGPDAAGFQNRLNNPKYIFCVKPLGTDTTNSGGRVPLVIQIVQKNKHRKVKKASIRVDLFKVKGGQTSPSKSAMKILGEATNHFKQATQLSFRHKVKPGYYVVIPCTIDAGIEKEFLIRIFSPSGLTDVRTHSF